MLGEIIDLARQKRMCLDYFTELKDCKNIDLAIPLYLKNPNWSLENKFLSLTFTRKYLSNKIAGFIVFLFHIFFSENFFPIIFSKVTMVDQN